MAKLIATNGPNVGSEHSFDDAAIMGRSSDADIVVASAKASRHHARITLSEEGYVIQDLDSRNGTFVDGEQVTQAVLTDSCHVTIGKVRYLFHEGLPGAADAAVDRVELAEGDAPPAIDMESEATWHSLLDKAISAGDPAGLKLSAQAAGRAGRAGKALRGHLDPKDVLYEIGKLVMDEFDAAGRVAIFLGDPDTGALEPKSVADGSQDSAAEDFPVSRAVVDKAIETGNVLAAGVTFAGKVHNVMCAPLAADENHPGAIYLEAGEDGRFTQQDLQVFAALSTEAANALASALRHEKLSLGQRLSRDLQLARRLQDAFLPKAHPEIEGYQFALQHAPSLDVSGDFFDFIALPNGQLGIVLGDVSGKGISAALHMARLISEIRLHALTMESPGHLLEKINRAMFHSIEEDTIVTLLLMTLDAVRGRVTIASAGHDSPLLVSGSKASNLDAGGGLPLCVDRNANYTEKRFSISPGELVVAFTDGLLQANNSAMERYGAARLKTAALKYSHSARSLVNHVFEDVEDFIGDAAQPDDIVVTAFGAVS